MKEVRVSFSNFENEEKWEQLSQELLQKGINYSSNKLRKLLEISPEEINPLDNNV